MNYGLVRYENKLLIHLYQGLLFLLLIIQISVLAEIVKRGEEPLFLFLEMLSYNDVI